MKSTVSKLLLCFAASIASLTAQEAWLLEMPNKFGDYLVKKSLDQDYDTVAGIVEKLPGLIASKKISEIELIKFKGDGKVHKKGTEKLGNRTINLGSIYRGTAQNRSLRVTTGATKRNYEIDSSGILPRAWTPTFVHRNDKMTTVLLERDAEGKSAVVSLTNQRKLDFKAGSNLNSVAWYSGDPLDTKTLSYVSRTALAANPKVEFGTKILTIVKKEGDSLLRMEVHSPAVSGKDTILLHHNEAKFSGHSEKTGPLKKEVIKVADKTFTKEGEEGTWTLTAQDGA